MHVAQFIKLEILILRLLKDQDLSTSQIYDIINQHFTVVEGELLVALFFLSDMHLISIQTIDDETVYHIEAAGLTRYTTLKREYQNIQHEMVVLFQDEKTKI